MLEGLSTNRRSDSSAACIAATDRSFLIRYHSRTTTQPIGTSPDFPAFSAAFSAKSMKDGAVMSRIARETLIVAANADFPKFAAVAATSYTNFGKLSALAIL